jgi:hypothetical protein
MAKMEVKETMLRVARHGSSQSRCKAFAAGPITGCRFSNTWKKVASGGSGLRLGWKISSRNNRKTCSAVQKFKVN